MEFYLEVKYSSKLFLTKHSYSCTSSWLWYHRKQISNISFFYVGFFSWLFFLFRSFMQWEKARYIEYCKVVHQCVYWRAGLDRKQSVCMVNTFFYFSNNLAFRRAKRKQQIVAYLYFYAHWGKASFLSFQSCF